jgi:hypothetical protein
MADVDDDGNVTCSPKPAELRAIGQTPRVGVRQYFAAEHLWAARLMAHLCREREDQLIEKGTLGVDYHVRSFALTAISESVALLEAHVNQICQDATDAESDDSDHWQLRGLGSDARAKTRELWTEENERSLSVLDKYAVTLTFVGEKLDKGGRPYQDVKALIPLRNALLHFKPELQWIDEVHRVEEQVKHLVPENPLMRGTVPWFPHHPLCAGVARWAWQSCMQFADEWHAQMGLEVSYRDGMAPWPDGLI